MLAGGAHDVALPTSVPGFDVETALEIMVQMKNAVHPKAYNQTFVSLDTYALISLDKYKYNSV